MKRKSVIILTSIILLILLTSCPSPPGIMGGKPLMFGDHFMFDQFYDTGRDVYYFNSDGTYEHIGKEWNSTTEAWEQTSGSIGTYTYDKDAYLMTLTNEQKWDWGDGEGYVDLSEEVESESDLSSRSVTDTYTWYITDNGLYNAYLVQSDGSWKCESAYTHTDNWSGDEYGYHDKSVRIWEISGNEIMYSMVNSFRDDLDAAFQATYQKEYGGNVRRLAPTDVVWEAGETVTFYYGNDVNRDRRWDEVAGEWGGWIDNSNGDTWTRTFVHLGDLMLEVDIDSAKDLIIE